MIGRFRAALKAFRRYDAAQPRRGSADWPTASYGNANEQVGAAARAVAMRARDAVRNDPYAARIVDLWVGNAVGAGITTRWADAAHADAWRRWSEGTECDAERLLNLSGLQALVMRAVVESGECFVRQLPAEVTDANPVGLRLQVLESDHLDTTKNDARTIQGIELDDAGAPTGYWLFRAHPQSRWQVQDSVQSVFVPVAEVLHIFRKRRPGQVRDVSWLAPVLTRLRDLAEYEAALLLKAKIESCFAAIATDDGTDETTLAGFVKDARGRVIEKFEPGMIAYRRGGGSIETLNPSGGGSHMAFAKRALEASSVGAGLTYDQVSGDLTGANYSSLKAGKIEFRRLCEQVQYGMLIPMLAQPVADRFHRSGALRGLWAARPADANHVPPAHEMIDPLKDTTAMIAQVRAGFLPLSDAVAAFGYDFKSSVEMIREANGMLDDAGLALDTDVRRVAKSGVAQDAKQLAAVEIAATGAAAPKADTPEAPPVPAEE